ncbi:MAG: PKD domain-containing protein [Acidimicrobiia bacterium]
MTKTTRRLITLVVVTGMLVLGGPLIEPAFAQKVSNPGNFSLNVGGGQLAIGATSFSLTPNPLPQCSDGIDNEASSNAPLDGKIDYPTDPECSSALDDSELVGGYQPKVDVSISGTIDAAGNVNVPTSGVVFPNAYMYDATAGIITIQIIPSHAATGTLNPLTGAASIRVRIYIKLTNSGGSVSLGSSCTIGTSASPIDLNVLTTGTTSPPGPNTPITGVPYNPADGTATLVNNSFSVPGASSCGPLGLANSSINSALGLPSAAGKNTAIMSGSVTPILGKGVVASGTATPASGFTPLPVNFDSSASTASAGIANRQWDLDGDGTYEATGTTASHTYTSGGTVNAKLKITDTQGDTDVKTIPVTANVPGNSPPSAALTATPTNGQAPLAVSFDGSGSSDSDGSIVSYDWNFGDGNTGMGVSASHTYTTGGSFTATLTVTDNQGATATASTTVTVAPPNQAPTASFTRTPTSGKAPLAVNFDASASQDPDGSIASWAWDFGDTGTGTGQTASHTYTAPGTYTASLVVTDNQGLTATTTRTVNVVANQAPTASFSRTPAAGAAPLTVSVNAGSSSDPDGSIVSYGWDFGDGNTATGVTASNSYGTPGTYTITLTVTDDNGATATATRNVTVNPASSGNADPIAAFSRTPSLGDSPLAVALDASASVDTDGTIASYDWDFGDGNTGTGLTASHTYAAAGSYTVSLTVTDDGGGTDTATHVVTVTTPQANQVPVASFTRTPSHANAPAAVSVDASASSDPDGSVASYAWDFGDSATGTGVTASHTYSVAGTYTITLTATDDDGATATTTHTVVVDAALPTPNQNPVAAFTRSPASGDAPLAVHFDSSASSDSDGTIVSRAWDFGDSTTDSGATADHTYAAPGTYTAALTVTDDDGATASTEHTVVVAATPNLSPIASFTRTPASGEAPVSVAVDASASSDTDGSIASYAWDFGDSSTGFGVTGSHSYATPGTYTITLTVTDDLGATNSVSHAVTVLAANAAPTAAFTPTPSSGSAPLAVSFDASASSDPEGPLASYAWDFGDGNTATGVTASHTYTAASAYTATLTVTDGGGKTASVTHNVTANAASAAPAIVNTATSDGIPNWVQTQTVSRPDSANGNPDASVYKATFLVKLDPGVSISGVKTDFDYNGTDNTSSATASMTGVTVDKPLGSFNYARVTYSAALPNQPNGWSCPFLGTATRRQDLPVRFRVATSVGDIAPLSTNVHMINGLDNCTVATNSNDFAHLKSGQTQSVTDATPGQALTMTFKCDDMDTIPSGDHCDAFRWRTRRLNDGALSTVTAVPGSLADNTLYTFNVTAPATRGRYVVEAQLASNTNAYDDSGWWQLGTFDVNTAAATSPTGSIGGPSSALTNSVFGLTATVADSADAGAGGNVQMIEWDADANATNGPLGDGFERRELADPESAGLNAAQLTQVVDTHGWAPGAHTIRARITDNGALNGTDPIRRTLVLSKSVDVSNPNTAPNAQFTQNRTSGAAPLAVSFDGSSSTDDVGVVSYAWDFGDGNTATGATASHTYATPGAYVASLTVTDGGALTDTAQRSVTVTGTPNAIPTAAAALSPHQGDAPLAVSADGSASSDSDGTIASYAWDFGDGNTATGATANNTYAAAGTYTVSLTVTDDDGATDTTTAQVEVGTAPSPLNQIPTAALSAFPTIGIAPLAVSVDASASSDSDGSIVSYAWDFGDGNTATGATANNTYAAAGTYTVSVTVTDDDGAADTTTRVVQAEVAPANGAPTAAFTRSPASGLAPVTVSFDGSASSDPDGTVASYAWDFGDGNTGTGATPTHIYTAAGVHVVALTVTDDDGATDTAKTPVVVGVNQLPTADFTVTPNGGEAPLAVNVDGSTSSDPDGTIADWAWDFGDGNTATGATASNTYATAGTYTITLVVTDDHGGTDTTTATVTVVPANVAPTASLTVTPDNGIAPLVVSVDGSASSDGDGTVVDYAWDFGDTGTAAGPTANHTYTIPGTYIVTLTVTDDDGATGSASHGVTVVAPNLAPTPSFTLNPNAGVAPVTAAVDASASNDSDGTIVSYAWTFGDGGTATGVTASHTYTAGGNFVVTLTVTDDDGATATASQSIAVTVNAAPTASFTATPASGTAPLNVAVNASASSDIDGTIVNWAWDFGDSNTGSGVTASHSYTTPGTYTITLTVTDDLGGTGSTTHTVIVSGPTANNKKVTHISGVATFPSTVSGQATVAFDVRPFVFFGKVILYIGKANYSDPAANKQANGLVLLGGNAITRYGLNGAQFTAFGFGPGFTSGQITYKVEDLSAIGGIDKVSIDAGGTLNYHNPGGDVTTGNVTVLPAP